MGADIELKIAHNNDVREALPVPGGGDATGHEGGVPAREYVIVLIIIVAFAISFISLFPPSPVV